MIRPMRYLRMLRNSIVAGAPAAAYMVVLVLQLNPALPLATSSLVVAGRHDLGGCTASTWPLSATRSS